MSAAMFFYWFGIIHAVAYALAGLSFATILFVNWIVERFKLKADLLRAAHRMFKERAAAKASGDIPSGRS